MEAAARVVHEQGAGRTTIADIARAANVPVGNVYYYFKTKDELVGAAISEQARGFRELAAELDRLDDPRERLLRLVDGWLGQKERAARYGCPTGTLAAELDKRDEGGLDVEAGRVIRLLLDWVEAQFDAMGRPDAADLAVTLVGAYQGMSVLANALRDPEIMTREVRRLTAWLKELEPSPGSA
ncbi:TetR family transcriptional regulator [Streptomyces daliensis]|uniref:TetR family transcriptional regulator n=1 Tax=Streptomyces daliensis TaxID=299421 RepID=A0A8T4IU76_9ACTN|nr:TetR family transcriptional regulator [Streptomyces daliensis]